MILSFRIRQSSIKTKMAPWTSGTGGKKWLAFWENTMRPRFVTFLLALPIAFFGVQGSAARAQMTVDFAKVTCKQFVASKFARPKSIAYWLSGYYNGKNSNTSVDIREMEQNVHKLETYCRRNYEMPVMDAAKNVLNVEK